MPAPKMPAAKRHTAERAHVTFNTFGNSLTDRIFCFLSLKDFFKVRYSGSPKTVKRLTIVSTSLRKENSSGFKMYPIRFLKFKLF